jgi:hypothetical protein
MFYRNTKSVLSFKDNVSRWVAAWFSKAGWGFCVRYKLPRVLIPMYLCSVFGFVICLAPLNSSTVTTFGTFASLWWRGASMMGQFLFVRTEETTRSYSTVVTVSSSFPRCLHALSDVSRYLEQLHGKVQSSQCLASTMKLPADTVKLVEIHFPLLTRSNFHFFL